MQGLQGRALPQQDAALWWVVALCLVRGVRPLQLSGQRQNLLFESPPAYVQDLPRRSNGDSVNFTESNDSGSRRVVNPNSQSSPVEARMGWHAFLADSVRFVLAPLILFASGFFTANFIISGLYTWPRTSRTLALTLTVLILCREFVYKEQLSRNGATGRAWSALLYSCALPYVIGVLAMLAVWGL